MGLNLYDEDLSIENEQLHFGILDSGDLIAGLVIVPLADCRTKLRQMWVKESHQGCGIGRFLIEKTERELQLLDFTHISLAARVHAIAFYQKLGYQISGSQFYEVGIPHQTMEKNI